MRRGCDANSELQIAFPSTVVQERAALLTTAAGVWNSFGPALTEKFIRQAFGSDFTS